MHTLWPVVGLTWHSFGGRQRGVQTSLGGGRTQVSPSHIFGGRQLDGLQTGALASTENFRETVTLSPLMTSIRWPAFAVAARSKVTIALCGVALLTRIFETSVPGLTRTCDADSWDRSKKPEELIVRAGEVPVVTVVGVRG